MSPYPWLAVFFHRLPRLPPTTAIQIRLAQYMLPKIWRNMASE